MIHLIKSFEGLQRSSIVSVQLRLKCFLNMVQPMPCPLAPAAHTRLTLGLLKIHPFTPNHPTTLSTAGCCYLDRQHQQIAPSGSFCPHDAAWYWWMEVWLKTGPILLILANLAAAAACLNPDSDRGPDTTPPTLPCLCLPRPQNFTPEAGIGGTRFSRAYVYPPNLPENLFPGGRS